MSLPVPNLDDKNFNELFEEARALIPRFTRQWTDHNIHDPGITLVELFSWLAEMQIYQLDRVTDANREKFLSLVGITRKDVQPAHVEVVVDEVKKGVLIPSGTKLTPAGNENIVFTTTEDFFLSESKLVSIATLYDSSRVNHDIANETPGVFFTPFNEPATNFASFVLGFDRPFESTAEFHIAFILFEEGLSALGSHGNEEQNLALWVSLTWEYLAAGEQWRSLILKKDTTQQFTKSGRIHFESPQDMIQNNDGEFSIRCRIDDGKYNISPRLDHIVMNSIAAVQIETVQEELGISTGKPDQTFNLEKVPILAEQGVGIKIFDENGEAKDYERADDLKASNPTDCHYTLNPENGEVCFGNGLNGRIPPTPPESVKSNISAIYNSSSGEEGNLPAGQSWLINGTNFKGKSPQPAIGGRATESFEDAARRARVNFNTPFRAITAGDFEKLALSTPGLRVARAKALPNSHPDYSPDVAIPGNVTVVVVPETRAGAQNPSPEQGFLETVQRHLEQHRLLTTNLHVIAPEYVQVSVLCSIFLKKGVSEVKAKQRVLDAISTFLNPLPKGGPQKTGWPFGRAVFPSEIHQLIDKVPGVDYVIDVDLNATGSHRKADRIIQIVPYALVYPGEHKVTIKTNQL